MANKRADRRKYHYIYKITRNDGSGKYYIGMHSTDNLDDGYFGSGKRLWHSINKHGIEAHSKAILEFLPSRDELKIREKQLVNEKCLADPLCMNLKLGGEGGGIFYGHPNSLIKLRDPAVQAKAGRNAAITIARKRAEDPEYDKAFRENAKKAFENTKSFLGKSHTVQTRLLIGEKSKINQLGEKNSQYGTCWVYNEHGAIKIPKDKLDEYLMNGYSLGRCAKVKISKEPKIIDNEIVSKRLEDVKNSQYPKRGSLTVLRDLWGMSHTKLVKLFLKKYHKV